MTLPELANYAQVMSVPLMIITWLMTAERFARFWKRFGKPALCALLVVAFFAAARLNWLPWWSEQTSVPRWALACLIASAFAIPLVYKAVRRSRAKGPRSSGEIAGVEWNWRVFYGKLLKNTLVPICPNRTCRCELEHKPINVVDNGRSYRHVFHVKLECPRCGFSQQFECRWDELVHNTYIEIERRFRIGQYR